MAAFEFIAIDPHGRQQKGLLEADSARQGRQQLRERNWSPLDVYPAQNRANQSRTPFSFKRGLSALDLALLTRQLATLIQAAMPVEEALQALAAQAPSKRIKALVLELRAQVLAGQSLADSLKGFPAAFSAMYRATVAAGEHSGHLGLVLEQLADYTEQRHLAQQKIQMAMLYPLILLVAALGIVGFLLGSVVPDVVRVFVNTGQSLPSLTKALISTSELVAQWGWLMLLGLLGAFMLAKLALQEPSVRLNWHRLLLRLPLAGKLIRASNSARLASTLAMLNSSGVPLVEALNIASAVISNLYLRDKIAEAAQRVREGTSLSRALEQSQQLPPMMLHMIASGEKSGELSPMLARTARHQESQLSTYITVLVGLFEPFMLVFMGALVLVIVLAILLPILSLNQLVG